MDCIEHGTDGPGNLVIPLVMSPTLHLATDNHTHTCSERRRVAMKSQLPLTNVQHSFMRALSGSPPVPSSSAVAPVGQHSPTMQRAVSTWKK